MPLSKFLGKLVRIVTLTDKDIVISALSNFNGKSQNLFSRGRCGCGGTCRWWLVVLTLRGATRIIEVLQIIQISWQTERLKELSGFLLAWLVKSIYRVLRALSHCLVSLVVWSLCLVLVLVLPRVVDLNMRIRLFVSLFVTLAAKLLLILSTWVIHFAKTELLPRKSGIILLRLYSSIIQTSISLLPFITPIHLSGKGAIFPDGLCLCCLLIYALFFSLWDASLLLQRHKICVSQISACRRGLNIIGSVLLSHSSEHLW